MLDTALWALQFVYRFMTNFIHIKMQNDAC